MNKFDDLLYRAGLTAQGCWDQMDEYDKAAIYTFAQLLVEECVQVCDGVFEHGPLAGLDPLMGLDGYYFAAALQCRTKIEEHFDV